MMVSTLESGEVRPLRGMRALITGASGFVGRALCAQLERDGVDLRRVVRTPTNTVGEAVLDELSADSAWRAVLSGVDVVVHLAARVHIMRDQTAYPGADFYRVNYDMTRRVAEASAACGVRRFVFLSSVKVNGEGSIDPYRETDIPRPEGDYARSKWCAEQALVNVASAQGLELAVLRSPLVYGPTVRGNFLRLMRAIEKGYPLPFGSASNLRSLVYVENLVDAIVLLMWHPRATGTFLIRDGEDLSAADLVRRLAPMLGVRPRLLPVPLPLLRIGARVLRREAEVSRLLDSLRVDDTRLRMLLGWRPSFSVDQGLRETARWYIESHGRRAQTKTV